MPIPHRGPRGDLLQDHHGRGPGPSGDGAATKAPRPLRTRGTNRALDRATDWLEQPRHEPKLRRRTVLVPGDDLRAQHTAAVVRS